MSTPIDTAELQSNLLVFYNYHRDGVQALTKVIENFIKEYLDYQCDTMRAERLKQQLSTCVGTLAESNGMVKEMVDAIIGEDIPDLNQHPADEVLRTMILRLQGVYTTLSNVLHDNVNQLDTAYYKYTYGPENPNPMIDLIKHCLITHRLLFGERLFTISQIVQELKPK